MSISRSTIRFLLAGTVGALILVGCGSDDEAVGTREPAAEPTAQPGAEPTAESTAAAAGLSTDEFASALSGTLDQLHPAVTELAIAYVDEVSGGPERIDVEITLLDGMAAAVGVAIDDLPDAPADSETATAFAAMVEAVDQWRAAAEAGAGELTANRDDLAANWDEEAGLPEFNAVIDAHISARGAFETACLELAEIVVSQTSVALDCTGVPDDDTDRDAAAAPLGNLEVAVADGADLTIHISSADAVRVTAAGDEELGLWLSATPRFADPEGPLDVAQVGPATGWPDDVEGWIEALGGTIEGSGATEIGGFATTYWDVSITEARADDVSGGHPAVAVADLDDANIVQFQDVAVIRLFRVQIDPSTALLGVVGGANPATAADVPDFIPTADEAFTWIDAVLPSIELR